MTVTSTVFQTTTRVATQRATIVIAEIETSTVISTIGTTISTAATQTDIAWVTVTTAAESATTSADPLQPRGRHSSPVTPNAFRPSGPVKTRLPHVDRDVAPIPRQQSRGGGPTITSYVTQTTDVMSISSIMITAYTTSTDVTTIYQTNTRCVAASTFVRTIRGTY